MLRTLYNDRGRFVETYFKRFGRRVYLVGDGARRDSGGYFWITGRIDDVINLSGHRLSTAEIESALVAHTAVAEAAVIAISDESTGQAVIAYVTLGQDAARSPRSARTSAGTWATGSGSLHGQNGSSGRMTCPRPGPARSCAGCCAT